MDQNHRKHGSLTALGRQQAKYVAKRLKRNKLEFFYISTMARAQETAEIIMENLLATKRRNCKLIEEGIPEFPDKLIREYNLKKSQLNKMKTRMNKAYKKYFIPYNGKGERHEALICHGNIIRYLVTKALGVDTAKWINFEIFQCSITTICIDDQGKLKLLTYGEIGHIPRGKRTHI